MDSGNSFKFSHLGSKWPKAYNLITAKFSFIHYLKRVSIEDSHRSLESRDLIERELDHRDCKLHSRWLLYFLLKGLLVPKTGILRVKFRVDITLIAFSVSRLDLESPWAKGSNVFVSSLLREGIFT